MKYLLDIVLCLYRTSHYNFVVTLFDLLYNKENRDPEGHQALAHNSVSYNTMLAVE
jgi:hypothetical protein